MKSDQSEGEKTATNNILIVMMKMKEEKTIYLSQSAIHWIRTSLVKRFLAIWKVFSSKKK